MSEVVVNNVVESNNVTTVVTNEVIKEIKVAVTEVVSHSITGSSGSSNGSGGIVGVVTKEEKDDLSQQQPNSSVATVTSNEESKDEDNNSDKETAAVESPTESGGDVDAELPAENPDTTVAAAAAAPAVAPVPKGCRKANFDKDVVYLFQFARTPTLPSVSPYCLKVETWLRLAGLKYENVDHKMKYRSKKGQLPFVELNGEEIADSTIIIKELSQKFDKDLDASLDNNQKNMSHAMISMIENHLLWVVMWWKSKNPDNVIKGYKMNLQKSLDTRIPNSILNFFFKYNYSRKGLKKVKAQGIGVHSPEEIDEFGRNDLKVLSDMLGDKPYFFGDEPTTLDAVAFPNLAQIYFVDKAVEFQLRDYMIEHFPNLVGHVNRMKDRCFPDWDEICKTLDLNAHLPKPTPEEKEIKAKDEEKKSEKEGEKPDNKDQEDKVDKVGSAEENNADKDKGKEKEEKEEK